MAFLRPRCQSYWPVALSDPLCHCVLYQVHARRKKSPLLFLLAVLAANVKKATHKKSQRIYIYKFSCTTRREVGSRLFTLWPTKRSENASLSIYLRVHTLSSRRAPLLTTPRFDVVHSSRHVSTCGLFCSQNRALCTRNLAIKNSNLMDCE